MPRARAGELEQRGEVQEFSTCKPQARAGELLMRKFRTLTAA